MTSRARVRAVLEGKVPDRIPNGLCGSETTGLHVLAYDALREALGLAGAPTRIDTFMTNAVMEEDMRRRVGGDILLIASPNMCPSPLYGAGSEDTWKQTELWGRTYRISVRDDIRKEDDGSYLWYHDGKPSLVCTPGGMFFDFLSSGGTPTWEVPSPDSYHPPHTVGEEKLRALEAVAKELYETTPYALQCGEVLTDLQLAPGGLEAWWMCLAAEPELAREYLGRAAEAMKAQMVEVAQAVGPYIEMFMIAHDLGDARGVTIGEDRFREIYKPFYKDAFAHWHKLSSARVHMHSCGAISAVIGDLIECGVDVLNPVQASAAGMEPATLKRAFGDKIVFYGGAYDCLQMDKHLTYNQVYAQVRETIRTLAEGGRYIFSGVHNLVGDTPVEHLQALLDAYEAEATYG